MVRAKIEIEPYCAARTHKNDIDPIIDITQRTGLRIEAATFIGSSPIRQYAEDWDLDRLLRHTEEAVTYCTQNGVPGHVRDRGHDARPAGDPSQALHDGRSGARRRVRLGHGGARHAERDPLHPRRRRRDRRDGRGRSARPSRPRPRRRQRARRADGGADRVHGTILGVGERVGNAPLDLLLINLSLGWLHCDLSSLPQYVSLVSESCRVPIPYNYPALGRDAFRTGTGVHAAAVIKARKKGDDWLADRVYSSVPAGMLGLKQSIDVGPMCGESNVIYWLTEHGHEPERPLVEHLFGLAKRRSELHGRRAGGGRSDLGKSSSRAGARG